MRDRTAANQINWQERSNDFPVGSFVYPFMSGNRDLMGRVVAVYPAIGMVDVQWPHGSERHPVEELQRYMEENYLPPPVEHEAVPGGVPQTLPTEAKGKKAASKENVAYAWVKKALFKNALYWASADRKYKATGDECGSSSYTCPKCKTSVLKKAVYKRRGGQSEHLLGCPSCLFLVKRADVIGHPDYVEVV